MRNSRGEWSYREPSDKDNYAFIRNSNAKDWQFEDKRSVMSEVMWIAIALMFTLLVSGALSFVFGLLTGGE